VETLIAVIAAPDGSALSALQRRLLVGLPGRPEAPSAPARCRCSTGIMCRGS